MEATWGGYIDQSGTGEWRLNFRLDKELPVDNAAPTTGKITMNTSEAPLEINLASAGLIPIWLIAGGVIVLIVVVMVVLIFRRRRGAEVPPVPEMAPPPPPEAPPAPPEAPPPPPG